MVQYAFYRDVCVWRKDSWRALFSNDPLGSLDGSKENFRSRLEIPTLMMEF